MSRGLPWLLSRSNKHSNTDLRCLLHNPPGKSRPIQFPARKTGVPMKLLVSAKEKPELLAEQAKKLAAAIAAG